MARYKKGRPKHTVGAKSKQKTENETSKVAVKNKRLDQSKKKQTSRSINLWRKGEDESLERNVDEFFSANIEDSSQKLHKKKKKISPRKSEKDFNSIPAMNTRSCFVKLDNFTNNNKGSESETPTKSGRILRRRRITEVELRNSQDLDSISSNIQKANSKTPRNEKTPPSRKDFKSIRSTRSNSTTLRTKAFSKTKSKQSPRRPVRNKEFEAQSKQTKNKRKSSANESSAPSKNRLTQRSRSMFEKKPLSHISEGFNQNDSECISSESAPKKCLRSTRKCVLNELPYKETPKKSSTTPRKISKKLTTLVKKRLLSPAKTPKSVLNKFPYKETPKKSSTTPRKIPKKLTTLVKKRLLSPAKTPKSVKKLTKRNVHSLIPGMQLRSVNVLKPTTNFEEFRSRLHVGFVPKSLPCREVEFNNIFMFLKDKLTEQIGGCTFISGLPGTGKTATVNEVVNCLKKLESQGELPAFDFVDINGMKLTEPRQAYVQIKKKLTGTASSCDESLSYLEQRFTTPASKKNMTLLLIDELDVMCTKRQDVIYNLLNWPTYKSSHLVVVTIANTMDLPERVLKGRVTSRLGLTRFTFAAYDHKQLKEIVRNRFKGKDGFNDEAVEFVARKIASGTGDARRALDMCRRATEIAESNNKDVVEMEDVISAFDEMVTSPRIQAIKFCSMMERKFLEAICQEIRRTGVEQASFKKIYEQFQTLCLIEGEEAPNITPTLEICRKLASYRLILWQSGADVNQNILMNFAESDLYFSKYKAH